MENLDNKTLSVLSLLIIPGILLMPLFWNSHLVLLSISMCFIGGFSFGTLTAKKNGR
jgi:hypothetical protein